MPARWSRLVDLLLAVLAIACLALAAARLAYNLSFLTPRQLATSSAEEEALFSIWSLAHGQAVYTDPLAIPYTASYFNWLFYAVDAAIGGGALRLLHLGDAWLPTLCRLVTLAGAAGGTACFFAALRAADRTIPRPTALALAVIALFNPLCGLWLITARPDIGAVSFEIAGVACFFRYLSGARLRSIVLTALCLYAAWSFKQTALSALGGIGLTLFVRRDWRAFIVLSGIWSAGVFLALATLGPDYRYGLYFSQLHSGATLALGARNLLTAIVKMPFLALALISLPWMFGLSKKVKPSEGPLAALTWILLVAVVLDFATACKVGAADYYFIPAAVWSLLLLALLAPRFSSAWRDVALATVGALMLLGIAAVFFGGRGTLDCRQPARPFEHLAAYLAQRPGPVFVQSTYGDLPWISPTAPHFVVAYMYRVDRNAGMPFERGGWENLLAEGYFSTVVTTADTGGGETIPPDLLTRYRFVRAEAGFDYFERK